MAEAAITLKLTPAEFDLIRTVLDEDLTRAIAQARTGPIGEKGNAHKRAAGITDLLVKLR